jgi:hypothetical protein
MGPKPFSVYFNPVPVGNWSNPDTFSSGILIRCYQIAPEEFVQLPTLTRAVGTLTLTFSRKFSFSGNTCDLRKLLPVLTFDDTISNTPVPGISGFPVGIPYGGDCLGSRVPGRLDCWRPPIRPEGHVRQVGGDSGL